LTHKWTLEFTILILAIICLMVMGHFQTKRVAEDAVRNALYLEQIAHHGCQPRHTKGIESEHATVCILPDGSVWRRE
jgi:hypothetical protein